MNTVSLIIMAAYLVIIVASIVINGLKSKRKDFKNYALAGKTLPWYVICATIVASTIGGGTLLGYVGSFYTYGTMYYWLIIGQFVSYLIIIFFLSARINRLNVTTIADVFRLRYGRGAQLAAGFINMVVGFVVSLSMISSFASVASSYMGVDPTMAGILAVVIFGVTACLGGFKGSAMTGLIQTVVVIAGTLIIGVVSFTNAGGLEGIQSLPTDLLDMTAPNIPLTIFAGTVISGFLGNFTDQATLFQRVSAARTPKDAKRAIFWASIFITVIMSLMMVMGLSARVTLGAGIGENDVIGTLLGTMNPVVSGMYSAAIIAAVVLVSNSMLVSASTTFSNDLLNEFIPNMSDTAKVIASRAFIIVALVLGYFIVNFQPSIMTWLLVGYACISCLVLPMLGGLLFKQATPMSGTLSLMLSIIGVIVWEVLGVPFDISSALVAVALGIIGFFLGIPFKKGVTQEQLDLVDAFRAPLDLNAPAPEAEADGE